MNLRFPIDRGWTPRRNWLDRWAARRVANIMARVDSYQCNGRVNWISKIQANPPMQEADVQVPSIQIMHWILREAGGYAVCEGDIAGRKRLDVSRK